LSKYYITLNPHGGTKKGSKILSQVLPIFESENAEVTVIETEYAGHARDLAMDVDMTNYDGFCCIGGDGTMHEAINGLLKRKDKKRFPLGLITGGTGNSFMCDMNCQDPIDATKRILSGNRRFIDVLECNSNGDVYYAFNLVGWGMPTDINNLAEKMRWLGTQRYNVATLIEVMRNSKRFAELKVNGESITDDFAFIIACNTIHVGKGMKMAPKAQLDDGLVDIIIVPKVNRFSLLKLFPKLFTGEHINSPELQYKQVNSFSIIPKENNKLNIDGELLGTTPVNVKVLQKEIEILI
jgi:YegS/Rv2252/BmrU family lipid kinase|tara:strand:- start:1356 stop:2243 length:888 start_codon:yes stop_codon:yes gene_type:complete